MAYYVSQNFKGILFSYNGQIIRLSQLKPALNIIDIHDAIFHRFTQELLQSDIVSNGVVIGIHFQIGEFVLTTIVISGNETTDWIANHGEPAIIKVKLEFRQSG